MVSCRPNILSAMYEFGKAGPASDCRSLIQWSGNFSIDIPDDNAAQHMLS